MHGRTQISRRNFVRLGLGATSCGAVSAATATAAPTGQRRAKQVLVLFEQGGVSQIDSWDPKPQAVVEHKSPFEPVATSVPGLQFTRLLARTAPLAHKLTIVRCMTQPTPGIGNSHPKGSQYIYSGEAPDGPVEMPDISSVVAMLKGSHARHLPSNIMVPGTNEQTTLTRIGFLPPAHKVFKTGGNPADPNWAVPNLGLLGVDDTRFRTRTRLLDRLNVGLLGANQARDAKAMRSLMTRAIDMLTNPATHAAGPASAKVAFLRDVAPILLRRCSGCHGSRVSRGGYKLHDFSSLMRTGESGELPVVAGKPEASELYRRLLEKDPDVRMPREDDALSATEIGRIRNWIAAGARFDGTDPKIPLRAQLAPRIHPVAPKAYPLAVPIFALAFSPDGKRLAVGRYHEVTVWNPLNGQLLQRLQRRPQRIHSLDWTSEGAEVLVGGGTPGEYGELALVSARPVVSGDCLAPSTMSCLVQRSVPTANAWRPDRPVTKRERGDCSPIKRDGVVECTQTGSPGSFLAVTDDSWSRPVGIRHSRCTRQQLETGSPPTTGIASNWGNSPVDLPFSPLDLMTFPDACCRSALVERSGSGIR